MPIEKLRTYPSSKSEAEKNTNRKRQQPHFYQAMKKKEQGMKENKKCYNN